MYKKNSDIKQPSGEKVKIWRYLDFTKFVSMLSTQALFFTRADRFKDPFEGSQPKQNVLERLDHAISQPTKWRYKSLASIPSQTNFNLTLRKHFAVNCWHMNEYESAAMWKIYLKTSEGIAIQSSYGKLKECITDERDILMGLVQYIDFENEVIEPGNFILPFFHKRKSFQYENEIRAIYYKFPKVGSSLEQDTVDVGINVEICLEKLIEKVHIAPSSHPWFADIVKDIIIRYGYKFKTVQSSLDDSPFY